MTLYYNCTANCKDLHAHHIREQADREVRRLQELLEEARILEVGVAYAAARGE